MKPFEKCPVCGGILHEKEVEKILKGGTNTAILHVVTEELIGVRPQLI